MDIYVVSRRCDASYDVSKSPIFQKTDHNMYNGSFWYRHEQQGCDEQGSLSRKAINFIYFILGCYFHAHLPLVRKHDLQNWQGYSFSRVCTFMCAASSFFVVFFMPHTEQECFLIPKCTNLCSSNLLRKRNFFGHWSHTWGNIPLCIISCSCGKKNMSISLPLRFIELYMVNFKLIFYKAYEYRTPNK